MEANKQVPDIEKLQHNDFDLDVDEQTRLQALGDAEVSRVSDYKCIISVYIHIRMVYSLFRRVIIVL